MGRVCSWAKVTIRYWLENKACYLYSTLLNFDNERNIQKHQSKKRAHRAHKGNDKSGNEILRKVLDESKLLAHTV